MDTAGEAVGALRAIPYMGVIYVVAEAHKLGFFNGNPDWCNLGQGQPEPGEMEGAPPRLSQINLLPGDHAYGPVGGTLALREKVAAHYNRLFRQGKKSQYTADNVSIAAGGRTVLTRAFAALDEVNVGYQIPDYTAYEDDLWYHMHRAKPVVIKTKPEDGFILTAAKLEKKAREKKLGAFVVSNPCNPTGTVVAGKELAAWVKLARSLPLTLVLDEFYSHFIYDGEKPGAGPVSAAAFIEDVNKDPVILIDGLTKCFRYPGWRLGWAVGPVAMIETLNRASSALDGGPSQLVQRAALEVLEPARADQETHALRVMFSRKRNLMVKRLKEMGIKPHPETAATFYVWASLEDLPAPLNDAETFFREALKHRVMTVPGEFFDVNPGKERKGKSPYTQWMRFSFGPPEGNVAMGLDRLEQMIAGFKSAKAAAKAAAKSGGKKTGGTKAAGKKKK
jgi:aspartate/methionine/tyrosine aminotransferase